MDLMKEVTERIISQLEKGIVPWHQPWYGKAGCISGVTGKEYSLINQCLLGRPGEWLTFKQISDLGGKVKKGEKSRMVVFWKMYEKETDEKDKDGKPKVETIPVLKYYNVFNIDQTEGITSKFNPAFEVDTSDDDEAESFIFDYLDRENIICDVAKGNSPSYNDSTDTILCPEVNQFKTSESYFSEMFHLMITSTGHKTRLDRDIKSKKEQLISEIGAASLCNILGLETKDTFDNSAAYIQKWIGALEEDKHLILSAAGKAEKAVKFIMGEA